MTRAPDLHELANTPGFGKAQAALIKAGCFDIYADEGTMREFVVDLSATARVEASVIVKARCEAEAMDLAVKRALDDGVDWDVDEFDVDEVMPEGAHEVKPAKGAAK